jgi:hypothetical protein
MPDLDPAAAETAFNTLLPRLQALSKDTLLVLNTDLQDAAILALAASRFTAEPEPAARFALLHHDVFDPQHLADLAPAALAAHHAGLRLRSARATSTEAKIPVALADEATQVKTRMLRLTAHVYQDDPKRLAEVEDIRLGTGYKDLAGDLTRLAKLYADDPETVAKDGINYRASDTDDARTLAQKILTALGESRSEEEARWVDLAQRTFTLLRNIHDEVRAAGLFLYRHDDGEKKFPSLYANRARPRKAPSGGAGGGEEPTGG